MKNIRRILRKNGQSVDAEPLTKMSSRLSFLDAIRGFSAVVVMLQHSMYASGVLGNWPTEKLTGFIPNYLELGETGVVAFFLVSGFVIPLSLEKTGNFAVFWLHRALRIYPLYFVIFAITFAVDPNNNIKTFAEFSAVLGAHLLFLQQYLNIQDFVRGSWTLSLEGVWYLSISSLFLFSLNKRTLMIAAAAVTISLLAQLSCAFGLRLPMGRLSMLVCCVLGLIFFRRYSGQISEKQFLSISLVLVSTIVLNLFVGLALFPSKYPSTTFVIAANSWSLAGFVFCTIYFTRRARIWQNAILNFLGRVSYSIYLIHGVVLIILTRMHWHGLGMIVGTFMITFVLATVTYRFVELPAIRFGHRFKPRTPVPGKA